MKLFKGFLVVLILLAVVLGGLALLKKEQFDLMAEAKKQAAPPPAVVTTAKVEKRTWQDSLKAVGSLEAIQGVTLTAEIPGRVTEVGFDSGQKVDAGTLLLRQDTSSEKAQLRAVLAQKKLARATFRRSQALRRTRAISAAELDQAEATFLQVKAEADQLRTLIAKKTITAPFSGQLGLSQIEVGQRLRGGEPVVSLQALDRLYVNFSLPQQQLTHLSEGQTILLTTSAQPDRSYSGTLTTIAPQLDPATRNIQLQGTLDNRKGVLRPGMYATISLPLAGAKPSLVIPATAVLYAPYGDSVFIVKAKEEGGKERVLEQKFVRLGRSRGDFVEVTKGLSGNEIVASTGVFKLRNGQNAVVDNENAPAFSEKPKPADQ